jgi:hypothetical protein
MAPAPLKLSWLLKQNKRYAPLLDTVLKLAPIPVAIGAVLALPMLFIFNGYLRQLNQPPIPVSQASDWVFLLLFGILASAMFAVIALLPAVWTTVVRWNAPTMPERTIKLACGMTALVTVFVVAVTLALNTKSFAMGLVGATVVGGMAGGWVASGGPPAYKDFIAKSAGFMLSAFMVVFWLVLLLSLLSPMFEVFTNGRPYLTLVGMMVLLLAMLGLSIVKPALGAIVGTMITGFWVVEQSSPDRGTMIASALYAANLGGGRPARIAQPEDRGEICNIGVDERQVLYFEAEGCSRGAAFRRLRDLKGKNSIGRRQQIRLWNAVVKERRAVRDPQNSADRR